MKTSLKILTFAWVRTQTGEPEFTIDTDAASVGKLLDDLLAHRENWASLSSRRSEIRCAIDQCLAEFDSPLKNAKEVAFFPPITGG